MVSGLIENKEMDLVNGVAGNLLGDGKNGGGNILDNVKDKVVDTIIANKDDIIKTACSKLGLSVRKI